jgi:hypothetical protein
LKYLHVVYITVDIGGKVKFWWLDDDYRCP